eukprot:gene11833-8142_t
MCSAVKEKPHSSCGPNILFPFRCYIQRNAVPGRDVFPIFFISFLFIYLFIPIKINHRNNNRKKRSAIVSHLYPSRWKKTNHRLSLTGSFRTERGTHLGLHYIFAYSPSVSPFSSSSRIHFAGFEARPAMSLSAKLPQLSTNYWQLKQCRHCGVPFDPYAEHPDKRPPLKPKKCVTPAAPQDPMEWKCPECVLVHQQHQEFPVTLKGENLRHIVSNMEQRSRREGALSNSILTGAPFSAVPEQRKMLKEVLRVQHAVEWLAECPLLTLRLLQQRVLCAAEPHFKAFLGVPAYLKPIDAPPTPKSDDGDDDEKKEEFIAPPQPLTFSKFVSDFLVLEYGEEFANASALMNRSHTHNSIDSAIRYNSAAAHNAVLSTGRPAPIAPVTSINLVYGPQDEALHTASVSGKRGGGSSRKYTQATTCSTDRDQGMMSEVMHWSNFFHKFFDENKEGQCRDPIFLFCAILLACAVAGKNVLEGCSEAQIEREIDRQCLQHPSTQCTKCEACAEVRKRIKEYWRYKLYFADSCRNGEYDDALGVRFFLGTPAVVLWAVTFLQLYRTTTSTVWKKEEGASHGDTMRAGEVYMIRDWIRRQAKMDELGFVAQKKAGSILIPSSCSTNAKAYRIGFTKENSGDQLEVKELKEMLKSEFPVMAYYVTFFEPPVTCRHTRKYHPKHWVPGRGIVLRDPAVCDDDSFSTLDVYKMNRPYLRYTSSVIWEWGFSSWNGVIKGNLVFVIYLFIYCVWMNAFTSLYSEKIASTTAFFLCCFFYRNSIWYFGMMWHGLSVTYNDIFSPLMPQWRPSLLQLSFHFFLPPQLRSVTAPSDEFSILGPATPPAGFRGSSFPIHVFCRVLPAEDPGQRDSHHHDDDHPTSCLSIHQETGSLNFTLPEKSVTNGPTFTSLTAPALGRGANNLRPHSFSSNENHASGECNAFHFSRIFLPSASQGDVYEDAVFPIVKDVLQGYNCCIILLGPLEDGVNRTLYGSIADAETSPPAFYCTNEQDALNNSSGCVFRALQTIFELTSNQADLHYTVEVSMVEIFSHRVRDLFRPSTSCISALRDLTECPFDGSFNVDGAVSLPVKSLREACDVLQAGLRKQQAEGTAHSLFSIAVRSAAGLNGKIKTGRLEFLQVGSHTVSKTTTDLQHVSICTDPSALCLREILELQLRGATRVPFEKHALTKLLKRALSGNCKSVMVVCCPLDGDHAEETLFMLRLSHLVRNISTQACVNEVYWSEPVVGSRMIPRAHLVREEEIKAQLMKEMTEPHDEPTRQQAPFRGILENVGAGSCRWSDTCNSWRPSLSPLRSCGAIDLLCSYGSPGSISLDSTFGSSSPLFSRGLESSSRLQGEELAAGTPGGSRFWGSRRIASLEWRAGRMVGTAHDNNEFLGVGTPASERWCRMESEGSPYSMESLERRLFDDDPALGSGSTTGTFLSKTFLSSAHQICTCQLLHTCYDQNCTAVSFFYGIASAMIRLF